MRVLVNDEEKRVVHTTKYQRKNRVARPVLSAPTRQILKPNETDKQRVAQAETQFEK